MKPPKQKTSYVLMYTSGFKIPNLHKSRDYTGMLVNDGGPPATELLSLARVFDDTHTAVLYMGTKRTWFMQVYGDAPNMVVLEATTKFQVA